MKVALILPGFSASEADWCIPALLDLTRLLAGEVELHVFPLRYPPRRDTYRVYGATVHPQGGGVARRGGRALLLGRALTALAAEHRRAPFHLLHAFWADEPGVVAVTAGALLRRPALVSLAGGELVGFRALGYGGQLHPASRRLTAVALHRAIAVTAGSAYLRALAAPHCRAPVELLPLGVDEGLFQPSPSPPTPLPILGEGGHDGVLAAGLNPALRDRAGFEPGCVHLLHVASLVAIKQQRMLLEAFAGAAAACPALRLHLVGEGPLLGALREQVETLGLTGRVCFHGSVLHEELPALYRAADFCVLASRHEAQGMVALEAAACGRVTVGTRVGILPQLAPAQGVPVDDVAGLAGVIAELAADANLRQALGRRTLAIVQERYTLQQTAGATLALYRRMAAGRSTP